MHRRKTRCGAGGSVWPLVAATLLALAAGACGGSGSGASDLSTARDDVADPADDARAPADAGPVACAPTDWIVRLPDQQEIFAVDVAPASDCGLLVVANLYLGPAGKTDVALLRLDASGQVISERFYGGTGEDRAAGVVPLPGGGFVVAGTTGSTASGDDEGFVLRLDSAGEVEGDALLVGDVGVDQVLAMALAPDGGLVLVGTSNSESLSDYDAWIVRLDPSLTPEWQRRLVRPRWQKLVAVAALPGGGAAVAGFSAEEGTSHYMRWVAGLDAAGDVVWEKAYTYGHAFSVAVLDDGDILFAGHALDVLGCDRPPWAARFGPEGTERWEGTLGETYGGAVALLPPKPGSPVRLVTFAYTACDVPVTYQPLAGPILGGWLTATHLGDVRTERLFAPDGGRWEALTAAVDLPGGGLAFVGHAIDRDSRRMALVVRRLAAAPENGAEPGTEGVMNEPCLLSRF